MEQPLSSAAVLATGTELTRGELVNGNAAWLSERLTTLGFEVLEHAAVPDDVARIEAALVRLARSVRVIAATGGLGPTSDDLTAAAVARALGVSLVRHAPTLARIEARFRRLGASMPAINARQADLPEGAEVFDNEVGTAPGFAVSLGEARAFFFPGVPAEMEYLFETHALPRLRALGVPTSHQVHIRTFGLRESEVAERLADLDVGGAARRPGVTLGYRAQFPEIEVKVLARAGDLPQAAALAEEVAGEVRSRLGRHAFGAREDRYPAHVGRLLREKRLRLAVAESCTGGLLGKLLTDAAGSSEFLVLDAVVYANEAKRDLLGVPAWLIEKHGAVSAEVASAMAEGAFARAGVDLAIAITGIAGPGGGSAEKPVGTVWLALARRGGASVTTLRTFVGDRARVRMLAAYAALALVADAAQETLD
jgi:nicotinamide-nucleotide amidase